MIPKLFGTISCQIGKPIYLDSKLKGDEFEKKRIEIENIMIKQIHEMDAKFELPVIETDLDATDYKKQLRERKK